MFEITVPKEFTRADGKPWLRQKEDAAGMPVRALDKDGKPVLPPLPQFETEPAGFLDVLGIFLNRVFDLVAMKAQESKQGRQQGGVPDGSNVRPLKYEDSVHGLDVFRAVHVTQAIPDSPLELEKAPYEWLKRVLQEHGPDLFGINTAVLAQPLEKATEVPASRAEKRRAEKETEKEEAKA